MLFIKLVGIHAAVLTKADREQCAPVRAGREWRRGLDLVVHGSFPGILMASVVAISFLVSCSAESTTTSKHGNQADDTAGSAGQAGGTGTSSGVEAGGSAGADGTAEECATADAWEREGDCGVEGGECVQTAAGC